MLEAVILTIQTMGWLGIVLGMLVIVNTICGTVRNVSQGEKFSWSKMFKGLGRAVVFYISSALTAVTFTMIPFINDMIAKNFEVVLLSPDTLNLLSSVAVLGIVITTVVVQGKKALQGIVDLSNVNIEKEEDSIKEEK